MGVGHELTGGTAATQWVGLTTDGAEGAVAVGLHGRLAAARPVGAGTLVGGVGPHGAAHRLALGAWAQVGHAGSVRGAGGPWCRVELRAGAHEAGSGRSVRDDLRRAELRLDLHAGGGAMVGGEGWAGLGRATGTVGSATRRVGVWAELPVGPPGGAVAWVRPAGPLVGLVVEVRRTAGSGAG